MVGTQNETGYESRVTSRESRDSVVHQLATRNSQLATRAFTLVELLVVITIIAILAGLITGAAIRALNTAKEAAITLEAQQLASALEDFKNEYGMFPPNVYRAGSLSTGPVDEVLLNRQVLDRALKRISSRSTEFQVTAAVTSSNNNVTTILTTGLSPAEALVFWLQGFSDDISRPLTGTDLTATTLEDTNPVTGNLESPVATNVVTMDTRKPRFDFDRGRLRISRNPDGTRRFITMQRVGVGDTDVQIQLYEYLPSGSQQPYVYFDTSRETPRQAINNWQTSEFFYSNPTTGGNIYPLKQLRADTPSDTNRENPWIQYVDYVEQGKFQILHAGIDDIWGDFSNRTDGVGGELDVTTTNQQYMPQLLAPAGPFIGDIADTLGNFMTGTLEDKQE